MNLFEFQEEEPLTFSFSRLQKLIADHYITRRKHPTEDLWILNYGPRVQYDRLWTPETLMCRGLVVDERWNIVARPWRKFFNWEELSDDERYYYTREMQKGKGRIHEKMDGSLIIAFWYNGSWHFTTRGSFESEQAAQVASIIYPRWSSFEPNRDYTYLFEIIYPENRIVVDYGDQRDLYLLSIIDTKTGWEVHPEYPGPFPRPKVYTLSDMESGAWIQSNNEGIVVAIDDGFTGFRFKMKTDEYKRLHKLLCHINPKDIWEMLMNGEDPADLCDRVPDEFYQWVKKTETALHDAYGEIAWKAKFDLASINAMNLPDRKAIAAEVVKTTYKHVVFLMLDGKDPSQLIWKMIKPSGRAFRCDDE